jgi:hypothetical protein
LFWKFYYNSSIGIIGVGIFQKKRRQLKAIRRALEDIEDDVDEKDLPSASEYVREKLVDVKLNDQEDVVELSDDEEGLYNVEEALVISNEKGLEEKPDVASRPIIPSFNFSLIRIVVAKLINKRFGLIDSFKF